MPTAPYHRLTRRVLWSASASVTLLFLTSASTLPTVSTPPSGFSLGLDRIFTQSRGLLLGVGASPRSEAPSSPRWLFASHPETGAGAADRYLEKLPFGREIRGAAKRYGVDSLLLASVVEAESGFRADAVSKKGALGLMQLMPLHFSPADPAIPSVDPLDPAVNLDFGARYLRDLRRRYDGNLELALAAYHAGPGTIDRFGGFPPYRETQVYVGKVLQIYDEHRREALGQVSVGAPGTAAMASSADGETRLGS